VLNETPITVHYRHSIVGGKRAITVNSQVNTTLFLSLFLSLSPLFLSFFFPLFSSFPFSLFSSFSIHLSLFSLLLPSSFSQIIKIPF